ncbi:hypothetical protein E2C01_027634 [Portunus trituberculatus]|uniref:Uncharacterized protein n=1 Tax=Portunus trituberculatus TaxID=210409 RepID=A0A5B7EID3_PORTR|nr:hypothetical protein [Portunus trituberculatus]
MKRSVYTEHFTATSRHGRFSVSTSSACCCCCCCCPALKLRMGGRDKYGQISVLSKGSTLPHAAF